jgi:hypothetical protein
MGMVPEGKLRLWLLMKYDNDLRPEGSFKFLNEKLVTFAWPMTEVSIDYAGIDDGGIIVPGATSRRATARASGGGGDEDGIVITPDPSGIVIKTRLASKGREGHSTLFENGDLNDEYVPPSLSGICDYGTRIDGGEEHRDDGTKVFLNICTHPLIAKPAQRKGLDESTGEEIDGWRLPMSMGDLRPCYDKIAKAAIVADCILHPDIVREMKTDPDRLYFVCDLVVQCASRKFGRAWFGGRQLDRRFKLPKMKYAGYVDETTGLPAGCESSTSSIHGHDGQDAPKAAVAKQRVKGCGGKSCIIEEIDSISSRPESLASVEVPPRVEAAHAPGNARFRIELFVEDKCGCNREMPLFDFLALAADQDGIVPPNQPSLMLRGMIKSPDLKSCDENENLHKSQLLKAPIPYHVMTFVHDGSGFDALDNRSWIIIAKTNVPTIPTVDLSPFFLSVSTGGSKTDCILPFPVDTRKVVITYNSRNCAMEIRMPLLRGALNLDDGPDPGTRQYEIQHAISDRIDKTINGGASSDDTAPKKSDRNLTSRHGNAARGVKFGPCSLDDNTFDVGVDAQRLPEDAFHFQDALSRHMLRQQDDEREKRRRSAENSGGREGADTVYVNVDDLMPTTVPNATPKETSPSGDFIMGLV